MTDEGTKQPDLKVVPNKDPSAIFDDLAALRQASKLTVKRKTVLVNVPVGKPPNNVYFRTHPALKLENATVIREKDGTRDVYYYIPPHARPPQTRATPTSGNHHVDVHVAGQRIFAVAGAGENRRSSVALRT